MEVEDAERLWLRGGFPDSYLAKTDAASVRWRRDFIRAYLERDIPQIRPRLPAETLRRFWTMLAHCQGGLHNAASLARGLAVDGKTIAYYLDLFVDLLLVRRLPPWQNNIGKRLVRSPKVYVRDSGVLHQLLGVADREFLLGHPIVGPSWEGFVVENVLNAQAEEGGAYFFRTSAGAEVNLVLARPGRPVVAIETKRSLMPKVSRGFHTGCEDVRGEERFIVYPGEERYPVGRNVEAIGVADLLEELENLW